MTTPKHFYIIATTPRTGSNLLCEYLRLSNHAGHPNEFFHPSQFVMKQLAYSPQEMKSYIPALFEKYTNNDTFGMKMFWGHLRFFIEHLHGSFQNKPESFQVYWQLLNQYFPDTKVIFLIRNDKIRQAISFAKARQTEAWTSQQKLNLTPKYKHQDILQELKLIRHQENMWKQFSQANNLEPHVVVYEELQFDPASITNTVIETVLGLPLVVENTEYEQQRLQRQSDPVSDAWYAQFIKNITMPVTPENK